MGSALSHLEIWTGLHFWQSHVTIALGEHDLVVLNTRRAQGKEAGSIVFARESAVRTFQVETVNISRFDSKINASNKQYASGHEKTSRESSLLDLCSFVQSPTKGQASSSTCNGQAAEG